MEVVQKTNKRMPVATIAHTAPSREEPQSGTVRKALPDGGIDLRAAVEQYENQMITQALERTGRNKNRAAQLLGLNRTTLVEMLKRKGL